MHFTRHKKKKSTINMIPLINVIFLMLIFFMVAGSVERADTVEIDAPYAKEGNEKAADDLIIYISANNQIAIDSNLVEKSDIKRVLSVILEEEPNKIITIKSDKNSSAKNLIEILDILEQIGGKQITIVTQSEG